MRGTPSARSPLASRSAHAHTMAWPQMAGAAVAAHALLAALLLAAHPAAAMGGFGGGMGSTKEPKAPAVKEDLKYIKCQVCEKAVKLAMANVGDLRAKAAAKPGSKLTEDAIIEGLEKMCDPDKEAGEWITKIDLQEEGDKLKLVDMDGAADCGSECRTVARACEQVVDNLDLSDMSEKLYAGASRASLTSWACYEHGSACRAKAPPLPADREPGPPFKALSEDEVRNKKLMRSMKEAGLSGTMYDRESMLKKAQEGGDEDEDDYGGEEDDDAGGAYGEDGGDDGGDDDAGGAGGDL